MKDCEYLRECFFFQGKMKKMPDRPELIKKDYCHGDHSACARYMVQKRFGAKGVPPDLSPRDVRKAHALIAVFNLRPPGDR